jgi:ribosomal protein L11 methyltransferase
MPHSFVEVTMRTDMDSGELLAMLEGGETLGAWEAEGILHVFWPEEKWSLEALEDLKRAMACLGVEIEDACLTVRELPDTDWNATWAASVQPIRLGRKIRIRQSWNPTDPHFEGIELVVDPKRAFGTGYHETTQLVIEWLERHIRGGERVLDIGAGTGILAMAAIRLGAASALAIDVDPVAIECAREYAEVNGFGGELELRLDSFEDLGAGKFDVISANLDGKTLPRLCVKLLDLLEAGGVACLSGLIQQDLGALEAALGKAGMKINDRMKRGEWLALEVLHLP